LEDLAYQAWYLIWGVSFWGWI